MSPPGGLELDRALQVVAGVDEVVEDLDVPEAVALEQGLSHDAEPLRERGAGLRIVGRVVGCCALERRDRGVEVTLVALARKAVEQHDRVVAGTLGRLDRFFGGLVEPLSVDEH